MADTSSDHKKNGPVRAILVNAGKGSLWGVGLGVLCLGVGLVRWIVASLSGRRFDAVSASDLKLLAVYVGAFVIAGALLGAAKPLLATDRGKYIGFALAGGLVGLAAGYIAAVTSSRGGGSWWFGSFYGMFLGVLLARTLIRKARADAQG